MNPKASFSGAPFEGALLVDKPDGMTSFDVIDRLRRAVGAARLSGLSGFPRIDFGHAGTLDPFATGLLVVLVGRGVKLAQYFLRSQKRYTGLAYLGKKTASGDRMTPILEAFSLLQCQSLGLTPEGIQLQAHAFIEAQSGSPYLQVPPMYSAKKQKGKRLYSLARQGIEVERPPQRCQIFQFQIQSLFCHPQDSFPCLSFEVECSGGTYIRTLTEDLAQKLGTLAFLQELRRTQSGAFHVSQAIPLKDLEWMAPLDWQNLPAWVGFHHLLKGSLPSLEITAAELKAFSLGQQHPLLSDLIKRANPLVPESALDVALYRDGYLVALAKRHSERWMLSRVFSSMIQE